jgi:hypothetical protein
MSNRILPVALAALSACALQADAPRGAPSGDGPEPSVSVLGDTAFLDLPVGRSARNGDFELSFDAVLEDSRCPAGVQCVWEGNASIRLTLSSGGRSESAVVNSAVDPRQAAFFGYTIGLRDLTPYPVAAQPTDRSRYVATIAVVGSR